MQFRALMKETEGWWIGWLLDLPGVNAQERTRERLIESLQIGAKEMLETEITFESDTIMTTIEIPMPHWAEKAGGQILKYLYEFFKNFEKTEWSVMIGT